MKREIMQRARKIRAVALDCDGVLFTGRVFVDQRSGEVLKERSLVDGQGISLLQKIDIVVALITAEETEFALQVCNKWNDSLKIKQGFISPVSCFTGAHMRDKPGILKEWLKEFGLTLEECAYMGDDLSDFLVLQAVGLAAAPAQAEDRIKGIVHLVVPRRGGDGAIRDLVDLILRAKGISPISLL